jgi:uracil-DNA glycosylase
MEKALELLYEKIKVICNNYNLDSTSGFITGDGPVPCDIMFLGEAPGKNEVELGKPFVGTAGKTLDSFLSKVDLNRESIRITNSCFFRPIKLSEAKNGKSSISNRTPKPAEVELFREVLDEEISLVNPKIIVTLGNIPLRRVTEFKTIGSCHGELYFNTDIKRHIFPMYHPSALTHNHKEEFKASYENDWLKLKEILTRYL